jgi:tRNA-Thr(GGU) m(6)t(6)A37 methyltransferase TsaA
MTDYRPIGVLHTPIQDTSGPIQSSHSDLVGTAEVFQEFEQGLQGIEDFSHIYLIYEFDRPTLPLSMRVKPFLDDHERGLFTTRYPRRPNPIGLSIVRVLSHDGNRVEFQGADMLDNTPLLDIKPYIPDFDVFEVEKSGWYQHRAK